MFHFLGYLDAEAGERIELPDDERLIEALQSLWSTFDRAGARAVGEAFLVSEREVRERHDRLVGIVGEHPSGGDWADDFEQQLRSLREQGRLVP